MKLFKRFGAALLAVLTLAAPLAGPALAAEPEDGIAIQLNGRELAFTDAVPEGAGEDIFLPFRAVMEAMGAQVDYDAATATVSARKDGVELSMIPGQTAITVTGNGQTRTVEMSAAPYINAANDRTYIPVDCVAEAFGYNVGWDEDDRTVILVDVEALFGDATFTLLDRLYDYAGRQDAAENMAISGNLGMDVTDVSGALLTGPLNIKGSLEGVVSENGVQLTGKIDMAAVLATLVSLVSAQQGGSLSDADTAAFRELLESLPGVSAELRADLEAKTLYVSIPDIQGILSGGTESVWYSIDLAAYEEALPGLIDMEQIARLEDAGVGESLVWVLKTMPLEDRDMSYAMLAQLARLYVDMFSDQAFTRDGGAYIARTTLEDLIGFEITLASEGEDITAMDMTMTVSDEADGMEMAMTMHSEPGKAEMAMDMSAANGQIEVVFHMDLSCEGTGEVPVTGLPDGVEAVPVA